MAACLLLRFNHTSQTHSSHHLLAVWRRWRNRLPRRSGRRGPCHSSGSSGRASQSNLKVTAPTCRPCRQHRCSSLQGSRCLEPLLPRRLRGRCSSLQGSRCLPPAQACAASLRHRCDGAVRPCQRSHRRRRRRGTGGPCQPGSRRRSHCRLQGRGGGAGRRTRMTSPSWPSTATRSCRR